MEVKLNYMSNDNQIIKSYKYQSTGIDNVIMIINETLSDKDKPEYLDHINFELI